jgi:hypothetical protein
MFMDPLHISLESPQSKIRKVFVANSSLVRTHEHKISAHKVLNKIEGYESSDSIIQRRYVDDQSIGIVEWCKVHTFTGLCDFLGDDSVLFLQSWY